MRVFWIDLFSFLLFLFVLLFSVMVHELGHFLTARHFHMKVTEFFVGFGQKIWSFKRGETEYGIKAIPAGGYCRISGMTPQEEISEADQERAFYKQGMWRRILVLVAGSFGHIIMAFLLLFGMFIGIGEESLSPQVGSTVANLPAAMAGIQPQDIIEKIDGKYLFSDSDFAKVLANHVNKPLTFQIKRGKQELNLNITPVESLVNGKNTPRIGVNYNTVILNFHRDNPIKAVGNTISNIYMIGKESIISIPSIPAKIPSIFKAIFSGAPRDQNSPTGVVGIARFTAQTFANKNMDSQEKIAQFLLLMAALNIFVGIFNLIPLLPLDGGHVLIAIVDGYRRKRAEKTGVEAKPFNLEKLTPFIVVVFAILVALAVLLIVADIVNPVHI